MENRFSFKDLAVLVLLIAVLASIWLAMRQSDRELVLIREMSEELKQQSAVQARLERTLASLQETGIAISQAEGPQSTFDAEGFINPATLPDPFHDVRVAQAQDDYATGDRVVDSFPVNVAKITPYVSRDFYGAVVQGYVLESLAARDATTLEWSPMLASTWKQEENTEAWQAYVDERLSVPLTEAEIKAESGYEIAENESSEAAQQYLVNRLEEGRRVVDIAAEEDCPPAVTITFRMRRGVTFSDGELVTARDVEYTIDLIMNPDFDSAIYRNEYGKKFKWVKALDDYTVEFAMRQPFYDSFQEAALVSILPEHFYSQFEIEQINSMPGLLMGSGPYRVRGGPKTWAPGTEIVLERNDRYWGALPAFDALVFREITNEVARLQSFENGDVDIFYRALPEQYEAFKNDPVMSEKSHAIETFRPIDGYGWVAWNQLKNGQTTPFSDVRVRRAMTMLIDRQRIVDETLLGYGMIPSGPFNELSQQFNEDVKPLPYDPEAAAALLAEAGYMDRDGDGIVESAEGEPLIFKHTYPSGTQFWERASLMIKDSMAEAGVVLEPDPLEWSVFSEKVRSSDFDAISMAWGASVETDIHHAFHSSNIGGGANNFAAYKNPELDALIDQARVTLDEEERMKVWHEVHRVLNEDQPYTFLYIRKFLTFTDGRFSNVKENLLGVNSRLEWYTPEANQRY